MSFTWLTYRAAIRRSFNLEYQAFSDHIAALRGPHQWIKHMRHTDALKERRVREKRNRKNPHGTNERDT